jgi:hypothetical protein
MQNFDYMTPTRFIFGKESIVKLPSVMAQFGKRILSLIYFRKIRPSTTPLYSEASRLPHSLSAALHIFSSNYCAKFSSE